MRHLFLLMSIAALTASCTTTQGTSGMDIAVAKQSADSLWTRYALASDQHDDAGFGAIFTDDATLAYSDAPTVTGRPAIQHFLDSLYANFDATGFKVRPDDFRVSGTLAVQGGSFEEAGNLGGKAQTEYGRYVLVMQQDERKAWRIARLTTFIDSLVPPAGAGKK